MVRRWMELVWSWGPASGASTLQTRHQGPVRRSGRKEQAAVSLTCRLDFGGFLWDNYQALGLSRAYTKVRQCCQTPSPGFWPGYYPEASLLDLEHSINCPHRKAVRAGPAQVGKLLHKGPAEKHRLLDHCHNPLFLLTLVPDTLSLAAG